MSVFAHGPEDALAMNFTSSLIKRHLPIASPLIISILLQLSGLADGQPGDGKHFNKMFTIAKNLAGSGAFLCRAQELKSLKASVPL